MLLFDNDNELFAFAKDRGWRQDKDIFHFDLTRNAVDTVSKASLDTKSIALKNIYYAKQLEMIVWVYNYICSACIKS